MTFRRMFCSIWQKNYKLLSPNSTPILTKPRNSRPCLEGPESKCLTTFDKPLNHRSTARPTKLKHSGETVLVENLKREDLTETFQLVESAARRGDNIGVGEYRNISDFVEHNRFRSIFAVRNLGSGTIDAVVMVGPYLAARTIRPCLASLQVVTSEGFSRESVWRDCFEMAIGFAKQHPFGLNACITEVFGHCVELINVLSREGFVICASVPKAGKVIQRGRTAPGNMHSYVMYKELGPVDDKRPSMSEFIELSTELCKMYVNTDEMSPSTIQRPQIKGLPEEHFLPGEQSSIRVSYLQEKDIARFHEFFHLAALEEEGFSIEEFPTMEIFWKIFQFQTNVVVEEKGSGIWVAVISIGDSLFSRSRTDRNVADFSLIISKEFRGHGVGKQMVFLSFDLIRRLGYQVAYADSPVIDFAAFMTGSFGGMQFTGSLPRAFYSQGHGWNDLILFCVGVQPKQNQ